MSSADEENNTKDANAPVVIDLGKRKAKSIKRLRKGKPGRLIDEVQECLEELRSNDVISESAQPVVIIVREKSKRKKWAW
ncbi:MAG: DUF6200 domain-containing protein [Candidatus Latescibacterota bacterium]|jgi:hypothetical protein